MNDLPARGPKKGHIEAVVWAIHSTACRKGAGRVLLLQALGPWRAAVSPSTAAPRLDGSQCPLPQATLPTEWSPHPSPKGALPHPLRTHLPQSHLPQALCSCCTSVWGLPGLPPYVKFCCIKAHLQNISKTEHLTHLHCYNPGPACGRLSPHLLIDSSLPPLFRQHTLSIATRMKLLRLKSEMCHFSA